MPPIPAGSRAPDFTLPDAQGRPHKLSNYRGRAVVIYFYPEDDTTLCTAQACQFRDSHGDFARLNCAVLGISPDDEASHAAFARKFTLPFTLLADGRDKAGNPRVSTRYGAWGDKNMYGHTIRGMLRTTYLIDADGKVAHRWDRVKTPGHAAKVRAAVEALLAPDSPFVKKLPTKRTSKARVVTRS